MLQRLLNFLRSLIPWLNMNLLETDLKLIEAKYLTPTGWRVNIDLLVELSGVFNQDHLVRLSHLNIKNQTIAVSTTTAADLFDRVNKVYAYALGDKFGEGIEQEIVDTGQAYTIPLHLYLNGMSPVEFISWVRGYYGDLHYLLHDENERIIKTTYINRKMTALNVDTIAVLEKFLSLLLET